MRWGGHVPRSIHTVRRPAARPRRCQQPAGHRPSILVGKGHSTAVRGDLEQNDPWLADALDARERVGVHGFGQSRPPDLAELVIRRPVGDDGHLPPRPYLSGSSGQQLCPNHSSFVDRPGAGLQNFVPVVELNGPPDECPPAALASFVDRGTAETGPGHRAYPLKSRQRVRFLPPQPRVITLSHDHVRAQARIQHDHDMLSAISSDSGWVSRSSR